MRTSIAIVLVCYFSLCGGMEGYRDTQGRDSEGETWGGSLRKRWGSGKPIKSCESLLIIYQFYSDPSSRLRHVLKGQEESMERGQ